MDQLTVFFENPFWVGVFECREQGMLQTCRVVFGAEPKDYEVYDYVLREYASLKWSRPIPVEEKEMRKRNPKRGTAGCAKGDETKRNFDQSARIHAAGTGCEQA